MLNTLWRPKSEISEEVNRYVSEIFCGSFIIGIQLRYWYLSDPIDTNAFIKCANEIEANLTRSDRKIKWFVTCDNITMLDRLTSEYREKILVTEGHLGHTYTDSSAYRRAILDSELLSKCDELILSGGSTFGFVAAMKRLKMPYYVNGQVNMANCVRMSLGQPSLTPKNYAVF